MSTSLGGIIWPTLAQRVAKGPISITWHRKDETAKGTQTKIIYPRNHPGIYIQDNPMKSKLALGPTATLLDAWWDVGLNNPWVRVEKGQNGFNIIVGIYLTWWPNLNTSTSLGCWGLLRCTSVASLWQLESLSPSLMVRGPVHNLVIHHTLTSLPSFLLTSLSWHLLANSSDLFWTMLLKYLD